MVRTIFAEALALLRSDREDPAVRDACAALLASALSAGVEGIPENTAHAMFQWIVGPGSGRSWHLADALGTIEDAHLTTEAIGLLRRSDIGREARDTVIDVLSGPGHASHVGDGLLLDIARLHEADGQRLARLVEGVHEARGIPQLVLEAIRDRWTLKGVDARLGSIRVAVLTRFNATYWRTILHDPHSAVRSSAASALARDGEPPIAMRIVSERITIEPVLIVKGEMLAALGRLVMRMQN